MIEGFEEETSPLTEYEKNTLLPLIVRGMSRKVGRDMRITCSEVCRKLTESGHDISGPRFRKIMHNIRVNKLIKRLVSHGTGYWISSNRDELMKCILSLKQREDRIANLRKSLEEDLNELPV